MINNLGDFASFLLENTGKWVLCPQKQECWDSKSLWFGFLCLLCALCFVLFVLVYIIGVDKNKAHGEERRRRCCGRLCSLCDQLESSHGANGALAIFYLFLFGAVGMVQVFGLGYDARLVLLFDVGCVLALAFAGGVLRAACPQLYPEQRAEAFVGRP